MIEEHSLINCYTILRNNSSPYKGLHLNTFCPEFCRQNLLSFKFDENEIFITNPVFEWTMDTYYEYKNGALDIESNYDYSLLKEKESLFNIYKNIPREFRNYIQYFEVDVFYPYYKYTPRNCLFGYDIAYDGGNYYSACYPNIILLESPYFKHLNERGLFQDLNLAIQYFEFFLGQCPNEKMEDYSFYALYNITNSLDRDHKNIISI